VTTDASGNVVSTSGHFPYGESWYGTAPAGKWKFTSYERDTESGNDYAMFRSYVNRLGRFSSPDPVAGSIIDPQSLNRYSYSRNDPINKVDPTGQDWFDEFVSAANGTFRLGPALLLAAAESDLRATFGYSYWDLPGHTDPIAQESSRHDSIIRTGYDPAFGIFRGDVEVTSCRANSPICYVLLLSRPTLTQVNEVLTASILWAAGPAGFAQGQLPPQAAAAGAGGVSVAVTWFGGGGIILISTPVLVTAGVVAVVAVGGYYAWHYFSNRAQNREFREAVRQIEKQIGRKLTQGEIRWLHDEISKQGFSLWEIVEIGVEMFK